MTQPRLLFAAPSSGSGKTSVVCGVLQALVNRGKNPVAFKSGPDYIDPLFHSEIIGASSYNLDLFLMGEHAVRKSLVERARTNSVAIIEGAMGFYDGIATGDSASAWDLADKTDTPCILVIDAKGQALSIAALVQGFMNFRPYSHIQGVILNRVSVMFYPRLKECIEELCGVHVYGMLPYDPEIALESRHLGLIGAREVTDLKKKMTYLATLCEKHLEIDGLLDLAQTAVPLTEALNVSGDNDSVLLGRQYVGKTYPGLRVAVAQDEAFCFYYADSLEELRKRGVELVFFSPLHDRVLPEAIDALYLGGGYPELHAKELSENVAMLRDIHAAVTGGLPCIAECGGFLYLHSTLEAHDGKTYPLVGVIDENAFRTNRLGRFGYVELETQVKSLLGPAGTHIAAHEFHYWDSTNPGAAAQAQKPQSARCWQCGHLTETLYAGFPHFHFASNPEVLDSFLQKALLYRKEQM